MSKVIKIKTVFRIKSVEAGGGRYSATVGLATKGKEDNYIAINHIEISNDQVKDFGKHVGELVTLTVSFEGEPDA